MQTNLTSANFDFGRVTPWPYRIRRERHWGQNLSDHGTGLDLKRERIRPNPLTSGSGFNLWTLRAPLPDPIEYWFRKDRFHRHTPFHQPGQLEKVELHSPSFPAGLVREHFERRGRACSGGLEAESAMGTQVGYLLILKDISASFRTLPDASPAPRQAPDLWRQPFGLQAIVRRHRQLPA